MKIGAVHYLNGKPLVWGLDGEPGVEAVYTVPSQLARMLQGGEIAAGLVSSAALFGNPGLQILPGICISSKGPVQSVLLFYRDTPDRIKSVGLDTSSLTSVLLAKIILQERYNLTPEFIPMHPSQAEELQDSDASVIIGDPAMCAAARGGWPSLDLGEEWYALTGLPFVFAVWAVNPQLAAADLMPMLHRSKESGLNSLREISQSESDRLGLPEEVCFTYLSQVIDYDLTEDHIEGLTLFRQKAIDHLFIPDAAELRMYHPSGGASA